MAEQKENSNHSSKSSTPSGSIWDSTSSEKSKDSYYSSYNSSSSGRIRRTAYKLNRGPKNKYIEPTIILTLSTIARLLKIPCNPYRANDKYIFNERDVNTEMNTFKTYSGDDDDWYLDAMYKYCDVNW